MGSEAGAAPALDEFAPVVQGKGRGSGKAKAKGKGNGKGNGFEFVAEEAPEAIGNAEFSGTPAKEDEGLAPPLPRIRKPLALL